MGTENTGLTSLKALSQTRLSVDGLILQTSDWILILSSDGAAWSWESHFVHLSSSVFILQGHCGSCDRTLESTWHSKCVSLICRLCLTAFYLKQTQSLSIAMEGRRLLLQYLMLEFEMEDRKRETSRKAWEAAAPTLLSGVELCLAQPKPLDLSDSFA